ncbi:hypothetical protein HDU83_007094 [Entophlyctis luteolus]|nr:hypothetical protein HDU82_000199 [Entophlyctis luteolus]KAJ3340406.1 hypothetical protein HDU83_007094 [Entophlyctis luteolus]
MLHFAVALVALAASRAAAFTNGTLIPPYICDLTDLGMGGPASLGNVIPLLQEDDSQVKIAGYHNYASATGNYASQNLCMGALASGQAAYSATSNNFIVKTIGGEALVGLIVWVQDYPTGSTQPVRIGTMASAGLNMIIYPYKCGETIVHAKTLDDEAAVASQSDVFNWIPPSTGVFGTFVEIRGVCITDNGYGKFQTQIPTGGVGAATM